MQQPNTSPYGKNWEESVATPVLQHCHVEGRPNAAESCPQGDVLEDASDYSEHSLTSFNIVTTTTQLREIWVLTLTTATTTKQPLDCDYSSFNKNIAILHNISKNDSRACR